MKTAFEMNKEEKEMWGDDYLNACSALHSDVSDKELMNDIALKVMGYNRSNGLLRPLKVQFISSIHEIDFEMEDPISGDLTTKSEYDIENYFANKDEDETP
jgi:hypothetical protein